jgi:hypothetical protein
MKIEPTKCLNTNTLVASIGAKVAFLGQFSGDFRRLGCLQELFGLPWLIAQGQVVI